MQGLDRLPGAFSKDLVEVEGDGLLLDEALHLGLHRGGEDSHQGLGCKPGQCDIKICNIIRDSLPVLCTLLVVALWHV